MWLSHLELEELGIVVQQGVSWVDLDRFAILESRRSIDSEWEQSRWDAVVGSSQKTQADEQEGISCVTERGHQVCG